MKNVLYKVGMFLLIGVMACQDELPELDQVPNASEVNFTVEQALDIDPGGNTVILRNETPETVAIWDYQTGKSNRKVDTIRYAFKGDYTIKFSALTGGGIVEKEPITISVTENNFSYVNDPLWINLTGGPGEEKSWLLDIDAKYFNGPLYFYGVDNGWLDGGGPWDPSFETGCYGDDCWMWDPAYADNTWLMPDGDYGIMTFNLINGSYFSATKPMEGGIEQDGTFFLDINSKMLTINDASILRGYKGNNAGIAGVSNWTNYTVFTLTEDYMQLGVIRDQDIDGEPPAMLVYNFISKEYNDNWVPDEPEGPQVDEGFMPEFEPGELLEMLTGGVGTGRIWELDADGNPVDWLASGAGWTSSAGDSYDWGWNDNWAATAADSWIRFDQFGGSLNYTLNLNGVETTSTFSINEETNEITLGGSNTLVTDGGNGSWLNPTTNVITVIKAFPDNYIEQGIWFGTSYNPDNDEWLVFHYVLPQ
jgi:hypothetical protein